MSQVWQMDATYIKGISDFDTKILVENNSIKDFLNNDRDVMFFIVATKGIGKTLLLRYKRILYNTKYVDENMVFIPERALVDQITPSIIFSHEQIALFRNEDNWKNAWELSIIASVLKGWKHQKNKENREILELLDQLRGFVVINKLLKSHISTPLDFMRVILHMGIKEFNSFKVELYDIISLIRGINCPTAIFIDGIDEIFNKHLLSSNESHGAGVLCREIWYFSQIGLMNAVRELSTQNHHIKVFASIRKEAFNKIRKNHDIALQFMGNLIDLSYEKDELRDIFINNIKSSDKDKLIKPEMIDSDPIMAFLGFKKFINCNTNQPEHIFSFIYRHTLKRPRDLMHIGNELSKIQRKNMNLEKNVVKTVNKVNEVADNIAYEYINEVSPHIDFTPKQFYELFALIKTRILSEKDIKEICRKFNSELSCDKINCKYCQNTHVFCNLYKTGLLGIIKRDPFKNQYYQHFEQPGEMTFSSSGCLPQSSFYFVHPILTSLIDEDNSSEDKLDKQMVVGDGYPCDLDFMAKFTLKRCLVISSYEFKDFTTRLVDKLNEKFMEDKIPYEAEPWNKDDYEIGSVFFDKVKKPILNNSAIIAEISDVNPNVFFECGMAVAFSKFVILIKNKSRDLSNFNIKYSSYSDAEEQILINRLSNALKYGRSKSDSNIFAELNNININSPKKKYVWVLSFHLDQNTATELKNKGYNIVPTNKLNNVFFNSEVATKLLNAKAVLVNLYGKQETVNNYTLYDSILMFLAGFCHGRKIPIKVFQNNQNFYSDVQDFSIEKDIKSLVNFVDELPL